MDTTIKIAVPNKFIKELLENLPEASLSMSCKSWDYEKPRFVFYDHEDDGKKYVLTMNKARKGFKIMARLILEGRLQGLSLGADWMAESGAEDWDADAIDSLVQCALLGGVIYG